MSTQYSLSSGPGNVNPCFTLESPGGSYLVEFFPFFFPPEVVPCVGVM